MRIAQVCPYDIFRPGGVQTHIRDTAATLCEYGHEVVIIAPRVIARAVDGISRQQAPEILSIGRARKIRFGGTGYEISLALGADRRRLQSLMAGDRFDVVHFHTIWTPFLPLQAFLSSQAANVATFHDTPADTFSGLLLRRLFRSLSPHVLKRLDAAIAVSEAPMDHLASAGDANIHIIPPCTNLRRFMNVVQPPRRYGGGKVNILFLGRLDVRKGAMVLLKAFQRLVAERLPVRLLVAGTGIMEAKLRRFVEQQELRDVVFVGAFEDADSPRLFSESDIVCAPSLYGESFGIVVAEAMASGRPVVAASNAGYRTLLTGEAARFLVPPGDVHALHVALRDLVLQPGLREELAKWGQAEAFRYDCWNVVPQLLAVYEEAIANAKSRPVQGQLVRTEQ